MSARLRACNADLKLAIAPPLSVKGFDGLFGTDFIFHLYKSKTARFKSFLISPAFCNTDLAND
jgi:hypothetical protein